VLVDGGLKNNYPADIAREMGADIIIGVTVQGAPKVAEDMGGTMSIISQIVDVNCKNKYDENLAITDLHFRVDTKGYGSASFTPAAIDTLIRRGEEEGMRHWDAIMALKERIGISKDFRPTILNPLRPRVFTEKQRVTGFTFENMTPQAERFIRQKYNLSKTDSIDAKLEQQLTTTMRVDLFYQTAECRLMPERLRVGDETSGMAPAMQSWHNFLDKQRNAKREVHIGLVGKYDLQDAYKSIRESLNLAGIYNDVKTRIHFVNSEEVTPENIAQKLENMQGMIICPGFGQRGIEGKIIAAEYTRTHDIPTFGICLGMQMMVIEFARNVLGYKDANSAEMRTSPTPSQGGESSSRLGEVFHNVIDLMEEQKSITQMGGTMRLGAYDCELREGSRVYEAYGKEALIKERHRHRYEFNNAYKDEYEKAGMKCVGVNPAADLVEIVEIPEKRWYIGTQFHPEYSSTVLHPHPLFMSFVKACNSSNS